MMWLNQVARLVAVGLCVATSGAAIGQDFKGIRLGSTQEAARQAAVEFASSWVCVPEQDGAAEPRTICLVEGFTYAGSTARDATLFFVADRLTHVHVQVSPQHFGDAVAALAARHGKPSKTARSTVRNGMGATFEQIEHQWRPTTTTLIIAQRFGGSIDSSSIVIAVEQALVERGVKAARKAKRDI